MNKFIEIAKAWFASMNPTSQQKQIAEDRMNICNNCESKEFLSLFDIFVCGECNCPLNKKYFQIQ